MTNAKHHKRYTYTAKTKTKDDHLDLVTPVYNRGGLVKTLPGQIEFPAPPENTKDPKGCLLFARHIDKGWALSRCFKKAGKAHGEDSWIKQDLKLPEDMSENRIFKLMNIWAKKADLRSNKKCRVKALSSNFIWITEGTDTMNATRTYNFDSA